MSDSRRTTFIAVTRFPYEEPYHTRIRISASNGEYSGSLDLYCGVNELLEIGSALGRFPSKVPDEYCYEYGSEDPAVRFYRYFKLRAYTTDLRGQCALQFTMNLNESEPNEGRRKSFRALRNLGHSGYQQFCLCAWWTFWRFRPEYPIEG